MITDSEWQALCARDARHDGHFYYGVTSTGVYCRPSCPSRLPRRDNVRPFDSPAAAQAAGFRACKRCHPDSPRSDARMQARIAELCRYIEAHAQEELSLERLGRQIHLSPFHLQRQFKAVTGISPKQYHDACRLKTLRRRLRDGGSVTRAVQDAGFGSASRVYERVASRIGMTPKQYRTGGEGVAISYASTRTPLGLLMLGATDRGLCFVQFGDSEAGLLEMLRSEYPQATLGAADAAMREPWEAWMQALGAHLQGLRPQLALPLDLRGTAFQMKVWAYLQKIPYGELRSYTEVAEGIGQPAAVRAVASACARNRVALLIPCHRVIRGDGSMGGYKWGLERKRTLIDSERRTRPAP